jgi:hypothetical protein
MMWDIARCVVQSSDSAMRERWIKLERQAIQMESWDGPRVPSFDNLVEEASVRKSQTGMASWFVDRTGFGHSNLS